jgi:hypothetical protein
MSDTEALGERVKALEQAGWTFTPGGSATGRTVGGRAEEPYTAERYFNGATLREHGHDLESCVARVEWQSARLRGV